jgi:hypothetical protein
MRNLSLLPLAATIYVLAWLIGLFAAPARPTAGGAAALKQYFLDHGGAATTQSLLVHGVAGLAIFGVAWGLSQHANSWARWVVALGSTAAVLSLAQVLILLTTVASRGSLSAGSVAQRVDWIDYVDVAKLLALAGFAVVSSLAVVSAGLAGRWLVPFAVVLAGLLVGGGASLLTSTGALRGALYLSLPLLLVWVGVTATVVTRNTPSDAPAGSATVRA